MRRGLEDKKYLFKQGVGNFESTKEFQPHVLHRSNILGECIDVLPGINDMANKILYNCYTLGVNYVRVTKKLKCINCLGRGREANCLQETSQWASSSNKINLCLERQNKQHFLYCGGSWEYTE